MYQCHHFSATYNHYTGDKYWCWYNLALVENGKEGNICWCRMLREDFEQIRRGLAGHQLTGNYWGRSERFGRVDDIVHRLNHQQGWGTNTYCTKFLDLTLTGIVYSLLGKERTIHGADGLCWVCGKINILINGSRRHQTLGEHVGSETTS